MRSAGWVGVMLLIGLIGAPAGARERSALAVRGPEGKTMTGQEIAAQSKEQREAVFKELDQNDDGSLSKKELANDRLFTQMDLNKDGKVTMIEYNASFLKKAGTSFQSANSDGDGTLTPEEMQAAVIKRIEARRAKK